MAIRIASVVELGSGDVATVTGCSRFEEPLLETWVMAEGQAEYGRFLLTKMYDNRIVIEKDFLPLENELTSEGETLVSFREEWGTSDFPDAIGMENLHEPTEEAE